MRVISPGDRIEATEKGSADAAVINVQDLDLSRINDFATTDHGNLRLG
jgi:hypothetical protein